MVFYDQNPGTRFTHLDTSQQCDGTRLVRYKVTHVVHLTYEVRGPCTRESFTALQQSQRARLNLSSRWVQGEMSKRHLALTSCGALKTTSLVLFIPSICAREACRISSCLHAHHTFTSCCRLLSVLLARQSFTLLDPKLLSGASIHPMFWP